MSTVNLFYCAMELPFLKTKKWEVLKHNMRLRVMGQTYVDEISCRLCKIPIVFNLHNQLTHQWITITNEINEEQINKRPTEKKRAARKKMEHILEDLEHLMDKLELAKKKSGINFEESVKAVEELEGFKEIVAELAVKREYCSYACYEIHTRKGNHIAKMRSLF